tara:strand:- start:95 stop:688 length:594 start_codon:yes stop_codon:yes gene_type:complete
MNLSAQINLELDLDPLVEIPEGFKKCTVCKAVKPETKKYFPWSSDRGIRTQCKVCVSKKSLQYLSTEKGFLHDIFNGCLSRQRGRKKGREKSNERLLKMHHTLNTVKRLFNHWEEHKKRYGFRCAYTGCIMTHIRNGSGEQVITNISIDRLHPGIGYTELNTVFCMWDFNDKKNNLTPKDCLKIVNYCKERGRYDLL